MSTTSGIITSKELSEAFKNLNHGGLVVKISSDNTELVPDFEASGDVESTFNKLSKYIGDEYPQPSYSVIHTGDNHIFISFIPDVAPIKQKMLYASTKSTLISSLGAIFPHSFAWTELSEYTFKHYQHEVSSIGGDGPLTADEKSLKEINTLQDLSLNAYKKPLALMQGNILYNFSPELNLALESFGSTGELIIFNIESEQIKLTAKYNGIDLSLLVVTLDKTLVGPQYSLYNYAPGKNVFIYSCPSGSKVKDRMLYAASKVPLTYHLKKSLNVEKSIEVGDLDEFELGELEDKEEVVQKELKFSKPKGPRRR